LTGSRLVHARAYKLVVAPVVKLTDERERRIEKASGIVASGPDDDPLMSVVIDAALAQWWRVKRISEDYSGAL